MSSNYGSQESAKIAEVDRLLAALERNDISREESERLSELVCRDSVARDRYKKSMMLKSFFEWEGRGALILKGILNDGVPAPSDAMVPAIPQLHSTNDSTLNSINVTGSIFTVSSTFIVISSVAFSALVLWYALMNGVGKDAKHHDLAKSHVKAVDSSGTKQTPIKSFQYNSGIATVSLEKIGTVTIVGPSDFEMISPMRARLSRGKIKVRVTEETGHGFQVETPNGLVTDLGTEFLLNVSQEGKTDLAVLEGKVDFQVSASSKSDQKTSDALPERLTQGDGLKIDVTGNVERVMSVVQTAMSQFHFSDEVGDMPKNAVIAKVKDNLRKSDTKRFYEIVHRGLYEDSLKYVDRPHEWNGLTAHGMPEYLIGADYIKTFNADRLNREINIRVTLSQPAKLYIFFDERLRVPNWLNISFKNTGDKIGGDSAPYASKLKNAKRGIGPGVEVDATYSIWELVVTKPGDVILGPPSQGAPDKELASMYGIAAIPLVLDKKQRTEGNAVMSIDESYGKVK